MAVSIVRSAHSVRLRNPDGTGCSWGGVAFEPDTDGVVEVPVEAVEELRHHGFAAAPLLPVIEDKTPRVPRR